MSNPNWKDIKEIVNGYKRKSSNPKIKPILAHASVEHVLLKISFKNELKDYIHDIVEALEKYTYVMTLVEEKDQYVCRMKAYLLDKGSEYPVLDDKKNFPKDEGGKINAGRYIREPFSVFKRGKSIKVATFKNSPMTEEEFNDWIELWRNQQITN